MANRLPWFKNYASDWLNDPAMLRCCDATWGVWFKAINRMWIDGQAGVLTGTIEALALACLTTPTSMQAALKELDATGAADVGECNGVFTLVNRRMQREHRGREANCRYQRTFRSKKQAPASEPCKEPSGESKGGIFHRENEESKATNNAVESLSLNLSQENAPKTINEADLKSYAFEVANMGEPQWLDLMREAGDLETARFILEIGIGHVVAAGRQISTWAGFCVTILKADQTRPLPENTLTFSRWQERKAADAEARTKAERERVDFARPQTPEEIEASRRFHAEMRAMQSRKPRVCA